MTRITSIVARKRQYVADATPGESLTASTPSNLPSANPEKRAKARRRIEDAKDIVLERTYRKKNDSQVRAKRPQDKAAATEQRRIRRIEERNAGTTCFACRQSGHNARDCPNAVSVEEGKNTVGMCYRCGSERHNLSRCKKKADPANPIPFALCFVCSGKGHLSGSCPNNAKGLYPDGGCCKLCGNNDHLAKHCGIRTVAANSSAFLGITQIGKDVGADEDDFHILKRRTNEIAAEGKQSAAAPTPSSSSLPSQAPRVGIRKPKIVYF